MSNADNRLKPIPTLTFSRGLGALMVECKCRRCPLNDLENGNWCKKGIEPAMCRKEIK